MATKTLGKRRGVFKPARVDLRARSVFGIVLIALGLVLIAFCIYLVIASGGNLPLTTVKGQKAWSWVQLALFAFLGLGFIVSGVLIFRYARSLSSFQIAVYQDGMVVFKDQQKKSYRWEEILAVQEMHTHFSPQFMRGPIVPKAVGACFIVTMDEGDPVQFDRNTIRKYLKLADLIKAETVLRGIPWEIEEEYC